MSIAIILVAVVIIVGVVVVAMGGGGELARDLPDEPAETDFESWTDVATYRPPAALLGYHAATTERALQRIARVLADRDAEIAWLRGKLEQSEAEAEHSDGTEIGGTGPDARQQSPVPQQTVPQQAVTRQVQDAALPADPLAQASQSTSARDEG